MRVVDIAEALAPDAEHRVIGIRPGEKIHEILLTADEARHSLRGRQRLRHPPGARLVAAARGGRRQAAAARLRVLERHERTLARRRRAPGDGSDREGRRLTGGFLPYGRQEISDEDVDAVAEALRADLITQGPRVAEFEDAMADVPRGPPRRRVRERHGSPPRRCVRRRPRPGRRGDHQSDQLRGIRQLRPLPGCTSEIRRHLPGDVEPRHGACRGGRVRRHARRHRR